MVVVVAGEVPEAPQSAIFQALTVFAAISVGTTKFPFRLTNLVIWLIPLGR